MATTFSDQALFRISFGVSALVFESVLLILMYALGHGQRDNNLAFRTQVILTLTGIVASILDNVLRVSSVVETPQLLKVFLQLTVLVINVFLTFSVFLYLCTYVKGPTSRLWARANVSIVVASVMGALWMFVSCAVRIGGGDADASIPGVGRILVGYVVELYFLACCIALLIVYNRDFERRSLITAVCAFAAIVSTIILQLLDTRGLLINYFGAVIGSYIFYIGVEIPDHRNLKKSMDIVQTLADAIDAKDAYTKGHSHRVAVYSREIARRAGYPEPHQDEIYMMGLLHDVGKIGVPDTVISKPGRLTDEEYGVIKTHPGTGAKILENLSDMPGLATGARSHHERYDGRGYPDGLSGTSIPEAARIIAVADAYDAMTSNRSYRGAMEQSLVREQVEKGRGTQFDPRFADIMLQIIDEDTAYALRER